MADDRLYLQCNICGEKLYLGKQFGWCPFYYDSYGKQSLEDRLNDFYSRHSHFADVCKWYGNYSIVYESDNNGDMDEQWSPTDFTPDPSENECGKCKGIPNVCKGTITDGRET